MNAAYAYNTHESTYLITNRIYYLMEQNNWSVKMLSDQSNIPYETLKKLLSRKTENTSFHNIMKIALAFNCNLNYFIDSSDSTDIPLAHDSKVPVYYPKTSANIPIPSSLPLLTQDLLDISIYPSYIQEQIHLGIVISDYSYHPIYKSNDTLLVNCNRTPLSGEHAVFLHNDNIYIRTFFKSYNSVILEPINKIGTNIIIHNFEEWKILGCVVGIHKL